MTSAINNKRKPDSLIHPGVHNLNAAAFEVGRVAGGKCSPMDVRDRGNLGIEFGNWPSASAFLSGYCRELLSC